MATNIPSHNLGEIADAVVALIRNPLLSVEVYIIRLYTCMLYDILVFYGLLNSRCCAYCALTQHCTYTYTYTHMYI